MKKYQIARRCSRALFSMVDISQAPKVIEEITAFSLILDRDRKLKLLFATELFSEEERNRALEELLTHLRVLPETKKFLTFIISQGHLKLIKEIIKISVEIYNEKLKKVKALVISPIPLRENYIERLRTALRVLTQRDVEIEMELDKSLIGGFTVKVGSTIYDSSLKYQLGLLRAELTK